MTPVPAKLVALRVAVLAVSLAAVVGAVLALPGDAPARLPASAPAGPGSQAPDARDVDAAAETSRLCRDRGCLKERLAARAEKDGPEAAFRELRALYGTDAAAKGFCHQLAHAIGHAGFEKYGDVAVAFTHGDAFCWSGYYHGVLESYVAKVGYDRLPDAINDICADMPGRDRYSFDYYNCVHGIGHGVMAVTGDDLVPSLGLCDRLDGQWEKESCYGGVFMQNTLNEYLGEDHRSDFKKDDLAYPCDAVDERYKRACYHTQTSHMLVALGRDFPKVFAACAAIPDQDLLDVCYTSIGRDASGSTVSDADLTAAICKGGSDDRQRQGCAIGAAMDFVSFYHSDTQAKEFCAALGGDDLEKTCLATVADYYKAFR